MKCTLIWPAFEDYSDLDSTWIPHGVCQLATEANARGHQVDILDGRMYPMEDAKKLIMRSSSGVFGFSCLSANMGYALELISFTREQRPDIKIVVGGIHPTVCPEDFPTYDWLVKGEGEITFCDILDGTISEGVIEGVTPDLSEILPVDRSLIAIEEKPMHNMGEPFATIIIGRGCSFDCTFCLDGDTQIMMADFTWKPLKSVRVGECVIGYEKANYGHQLVSTEVQYRFHRKAEVFEILTDRGSVIATSEHRWLSYNNHSRWRHTKNLKQGDVISWLAEPTTTGETAEYRNGYIAGAALGDGSIGHYKRTGRNGYTDHFRLVGDDEMLDTFHQYAENQKINVHECGFNGGPVYPNVNRAVGGFSRETVSQIDTLCSRSTDSAEFKRGVLSGLLDSDGSVSKRGQTVRFCNSSDPKWFKHERYDSLADLIEGHLADFGFRTVREEKSIRVLGGVSENIRLVSLLQPSVANKRRFGASPNNGGATVIRVEPLGVREVYNIATGTENYIANGFISHNCQPAERTLFGRKLRMRPVHSVVNELVSLNIKSFMVHDDCFLSSKKYVREFCEALPSGMTWWCQGRADIVCSHIDMISEMRNCGLSGMIIGHESGDQRMLDALRKGTTVEQNVESVRILNALGVMAWSNIMLGLPNEPPSAAINTIAMVKAMAPQVISTSVFTPHPGSYLYDELKDRMLKNDWTYYNRGKFEPKITGVDYNFVAWTAQQLRG